MKYAFFVGCTVLSRLPGYEKSARRVAERLGVELLDMPGSGCCGTTYLETLDHKTGLAIAARNLAIAEEMGMNVVTICNGCTEVLTKANKELKENPELKEEINEILAKAGKKFNGTIEVKHYVRMLKEDVGLQAISKESSRSLKGVKVASHYGCHMLKPREILLSEDPENPTAMDDLVATTGAEPIDYPSKLECCAGPVMGVRENVTWSVGLDKVNEVMLYGDALVTACPFCYLTYERAQLMRETDNKLPILHLPQLLGLAMGLEPGELGLGHNKASPDIIITKQRQRND
jgi:heterodisulfide reductase subunit B